jgi:hypothetical protein
MKRTWLFLVAGLLGCGSGVAISPGLTLLQRLDQYREQMAVFEQSPERWPERQAMGESLKTQYRILVGRSPEFDRLVDLDVKRRELLLTLRNPSLKPDRAREIKEELAQIDKDREALKNPIKEQVQQAELQTPREQTQSQEAIAAAIGAIGLFSLRLDAFSSAGLPTGGAARSVSVGGRYLVTDHGRFVTVRTPEEQTYRCLPMIVDEGGAAIRCELPAK